MKIKKILVAIDFSKLSYEALDYAIDLARDLGAKLSVIYVVEPLEFAGVDVLGGTPIATQSKTPMVNMLAATSSVIDASPYMVRVSMTLPQVTLGIAEWAPKNGIKKAVTLVSDYGPGIDAERSFRDRFMLNGGQVLESIRVPMRNPDFAPFLQKVRDLNPEAVFVFVGAGMGGAVMKQFNERGLAKAGIRMIGTGDVVDDDLLESMGAPAAGVITSFHYSAAHDSAENRAYVEGMMKANPGLRPNFHSVGGYDGMHLIAESVRKTNGAGSGEQLVAAMKGMKWMSPRGPVTIDPEARDVVQTVYLREVKLVNGKPWSIEFDKVENVGPGG